MIWPTVQVLHTSLGLTEKMNRGFLHGEAPVYGDDCIWSRSGDRSASFALRCGSELFGWKTLFETICERDKHYRSHTLDILKKFQHVPRWKTKSDSALRRLATTNKCSPWFKGSWSDWITFDPQKHQWEGQLQIWWSKPWFVHIQTIYKMYYLSFHVWKKFWYVNKIEDGRWIHIQKHISRQQAAPGMRQNDNAVNKTNRK